MNATERNDTLSPRQRRAIIALVTCATVEEAAKAAQIGKTTIYKWLKEPSFADALEEARQEQAQEALTFLRSCLLRATRKLSDLLGSPNEGIAHRAAVSLLDHGLKAIELTDQQQQIEALGEQLRMLMEADNFEGR